jgi:diguanylate cyclase (GGDEF)-like protein
VPTTWATQQLAEFVAAISSCQDETSAVRRAIERAAEALEADAAALVREDGVVECLGFPATTAPERRLLAVAEAGSGPIDVPGVGECVVAVAPLDGAAGRLLLARAATDPFAAAELSLVHGMARVLGLSLRNARLVDALQHRQLLLERLSRIQRSIVRRVAHEDVLEAIIAGAIALLGDEVAALRILDPEDRGFLVVAACHGIDPDLMARIPRTPVGHGAGGRAVSEDRLVVIENYRESAVPSAYADPEIEAAMAAPVREEGKVVGSLVVASRVPGRRYSEAEREALASLAEHASLALTDARRVEGAIHQALHDPLTGLPNRTLFRDRLEHALARRSRRPVAVLFIDLDSFKRINDTLGHGVGDRLLAAVGARLMACARRGDTFARLGGDEFAMLIEELNDPATPAAIAKRLLEALTEPFDVGKGELHVSASIGIASGRGAPDTLLRNADLAMYKAKTRGRGRYELFDPALHAAVVERVAVEADLRRALDMAELELHYQPIVELETGRVVSFEALLRWPHPHRGMVPPGVFVPIAEETGLIQPIGRWVLEEACRQVTRWRAAGCEVSVSVNLSPAQLHDNGIVDFVAATLDATKLDPRALALELTETNLMEDVDAIGLRLADLKALGVSLAVDDFGTGYSSLLYVDRLPIDTLKIDKLFIDGLGVSEQEPTLAHAIINLGRSLGLRVVAEGVERPEQVARLVALGCRLGQGFHFHRPLPAHAAERLLGIGTSRRKAAARR